MRMSSWAAWPLTWTPLPSPVDDGGADLEQTVDGRHHADLVAGDRLGRDDHGVALVERDLRVVVERHARERREGLALAPGREDEDLLGPVVVDLGELDHGAVRHVEIARGCGRCSTFFCIERPETANLRPCRWAIGDRLLHAVDVRGEAGDDDAPLGLGEDLVEGLADGALRGRRARRLDVGGVAEQGKHALLAELGERVDVGDATVDGRVVELVVAGEHDGARGRCR